MFYNESVGRYVTQDSYLSSACDFSRGLCIDASTAASSSSGVRYMGSLKTLGFSVIDFRRSFLPSDQHDAPISLDGPTQVGNLFAHSRISWKYLLAEFYPFDKIRIVYWLNFS